MAPLRHWHGLADLRSDAVPPYDAAPAYLKRCAPGGPEAASIAWQGETADAYGTPTGNNGLYGVDLHDEYQLQNSSTSTSFPAFIAQQAMDTANEYHGATWPTARPVQCQGYTELLLAPNFGIVNIARSSTFSVPANSGTVVELLFANGGGATLPFATVLSQIEATYSGGGG